MAAIVCVSCSFARLSSFHRQRIQLKVYRYIIFIICRTFAMDKEHFKYRMSAHIHKLALNKNLPFQTRVIWKRNVNKSQTDIVTHTNCVSHYDQTLQLELNMVFSKSQNKFEPKQTQFSIEVTYQGKVKSGGFAKYDAAEILNSGKIGEPIKITLQQCPDPKAFLEVTFNYETAGDTSRSLFSQLSMMGENGMENDLSQLDFQEDGLTQNILSIKQTDNHPENHPKIEQKQNKTKNKNSELIKISNVINSFQKLAEKCKEKPQNTFQKQNQELLSKIKELEQIIILKDKLISQKQIKIKQLNNENAKMKTKIENLQAKLTEQQTEEQDEQTQNWRQKYEQVFKEMDLLKNSSKQRQLSDSRAKTNALIKSKSISPSRFMPESPQRVEQVSQDDLTSDRFESLRRQNVELQTRIASMSHNLGKLFNASYQYGGPQLLDFLQNSIGLTEGQ